MCGVSECEEFVILVVAVVHVRRPKPICCTRACLRHVCGWVVCTSVRMQTRVVKISSRSDLLYIDFADISYDYKMNVDSTLYSLYVYIV